MSGVVMAHRLECLKKEVSAKNNLLSAGLEFLDALENFKGYPQTYPHDELDAFKRARESYRSANAEMNAAQEEIISLFNGT